MMNWWQILEIPRESDKQTIKKAYASLLKKYHPEEDPEGYQRLREAYDAALHHFSEEPQIENVSTDEKPQSHIIPTKWQEQVATESLQKSKLPLEENPLIQIERASNAWLEQARLLYEDLERRDQKEEWEQLLSSPSLWNLDTANLIKNKLFRFLEDHYYLHSVIWELLEKQFKWNLDSTNIESSNNPKTQRILRLLQSEEKVCFNSIKIPHYRYIEDIPEALKQTYIEQREKGYYLLVGNQFQAAYEVLLEAYKLSRQDPELLRLMGECALRLGDRDLAIHYYRIACEMNPKDIDSLSKLAQFLTWTKGECEEALVYFKAYRMLRGEDETVIYGLAYCYYHTENWIKAKEYMEKLSLIRNDKQIRKYIRNINAHIAGRWAFKLKKTLLGK